VTFGSPSKLTQIDAYALSACYGLKSICLPASIEILGKNSFSGCKSLLSLTFDSPSKLTQIQDFALYRCSSLRSICLPASLQMIDGSALAGTSISRIMIEDGNRNFGVSEAFLLDGSGIAVIRYFGHHLIITLPRQIETLSPHCFFGCDFIRSFNFESGSKLTRIEANALSDCSSLEAICLPASLQKIDGSAFSGTRITGISVEAGNHHFDVSDSFLVDIDRTSVIRYFGSDSTVTLKRNIEILSTGCFSGCQFLRSLDFEPGSHLTRIEARAFSDCFSFKSIHLPASVEFLGEASFSSCNSLSSFTFESESKLTQIEAKALSGCNSLPSICLPASLRTIDGSAFARTDISIIAVEDGNRHLSVSGDFLVDFDCISVIRYFGTDPSVTLSRDIEILGTGCFSACRVLSSLSFESGSKLSRIEANAFSDCLHLRSIVIPQSIQELRKDWASRSSLHEVTFESALSLRKMIESDKVDLSSYFEVKFIERDCALDFPGYSVESVRTGANDLFRLVKISCDA
jgi:hypothetical protein